MKLKLTGLLMFSQASAVAARGTPEWAAENTLALRRNVHVNEQNYRGKMCGSDLFVIPEPTDGRAINTRAPYGNAEKEKAASIKIQYDAYCYASTKYDEAVEKKKTANGSSIGEADLAIEKNGMTVATACEGLKQQKQLNRNEFNSYFVKPKPCPRWSHGSR